MEGGETDTQICGFRERRDWFHGMEIQERDIHNICIFLD
jgi:hypothetical protein